VAPKAKPLNAETRAALRKKAKSSGFSYDKLEQVYRRGQGAFLSGGSRNVSMEAWAMGRVNSFVTGKGQARQADADLLRPKSKAKPKAKSKAKPKAKAKTRTRKRK